MAVMCVICNERMVTKNVNYDHEDKHFFSVPMRVCVNEKCPGLQSATIVTKKRLTKPRQY